MEWWAGEHATPGGHSICHTAPDQSQPDLCKKNQPMKREILTDEARDLDSLLSVKPASALTLSFQI